MQKQEMCQGGGRVNRWWDGIAIARAICVPARCDCGIGYGIMMGAMGRGANYMPILDRFDMNLTGIRPNPPLIHLCIRIHICI